MKPIRFIRKGINILARRIKKQGVRVTAVWVYARGIPKLTGVPLLRYSAVTPNLYVGPQYNKSGKRHLERTGIHYGVNMRIEYDDAEKGLSLANYCHLPTIDDDAPTLEALEEGVQFIQDAIQSGGKVYIHCAGGIGRAPTMAAAYLISEGHTLDEAITKISKVRPFINVMPVQLERLREFETIIVERQHQNEL